MTNINVSQCRAARAVLRMKLRELSERAGVGSTTITVWESGRSNPTPETLDRIRKVFEAEGIVFLNDGDMPGLRFKR